MSTPTPRTDAFLAILSPDDFARKLTADKAAFCMERDGSVVTGFVLTDKAGGVGIVNQSAVRWLSQSEMQTVMNPPCAVIIASGSLTNAGTMVVGGEVRTGLFVSISRPQLEAIKCIPFNERVDVRKATT